ncbi:MAG: NfeD family protein [Planctomycetes bacterium]|nr:NfeD family protein [Planctomycetota bacterium]
MSSNTNLYGFLHPRLFGLTSIRHTLTPRIAYSFTPAVTRHDELRSYTGAGSGSSRRSQSLSIGISNTLDARLFEGENEKKVSLLNFNLSTRYNFEKDERRWSNLSGSARTSLAQRLDLTANATWDPYDTETLKLQWTRARLTNFGISAGMSLKGDASALSSVTALGGDPYRGAARVGDVGYAEGSMHPSGKARFGSVLVDVVTQGEFLDPDARVEVIERRGNRVVVREVKNA